MSRRDPNIIDRLAGLIPGYRGYADRDGRRGSDKMLRDSVAAELTRAQAAVRELVLTLTDRNQTASLGDLDRLAREIGTCADAIRMAPTGGSGLMDDVVVKAADLDRAHAHDLELKEKATELTAAVATAAATGDAAQVLALAGRVKEIRDGIARREDVLREVQ